MSCPPVLNEQSSRAGVGVERVDDADAGGGVDHAVEHGGRGVEGPAALARLEGPDRRAAGGGVSVEVALRGRVHDGLAERAARGHHGRDVAGGAERGGPARGSASPRSPCRSPSRRRHRSGRDRRGTWASPPPGQPAGAVSRPPPRAGGCAAASVPASATPVTAAISAGLDRIHPNMRTLPTRGGLLTNLAGRWRSSRRVG